jgi:hypothetical protein
MSQLTVGRLQWKSATYLMYRAARKINHLHRKKFYILINSLFTRSVDRPDYCTGTMVGGFLHDLF